VIYFQGVQLFKYEAGKQSPTPLGKVGAAVLHTQSSNKWTLLLYYTPQKPITTTSLTAELKWTVTLQGTELWGQLTDDAAQSWAIHFPTRDECETLSAQLALAQWSAARTEGLGSLDLIVPSKGHTIEAGDLVGIRYSAWTSAQNKIGAKYESNTDKERPLRFEVGKGSVLAGLDRGVLGMKRGQRRVLVLPAGLGYGDKGLAPHVTANMTLVFVVELEKMKKSGTSGASETRVENSASEELQAPLPTLPSVDVLSSSPTSAVVENSPEDKAKSKLMERISKLGVPTMTAKPVIPVSSSPPQSIVASVEPQSAVQPEVTATNVPAPQPYVPPAQPLLTPTQPQPMYHTGQLAMSNMNPMSAPQHGQMVLSSQYSAQGMYPQQLNYGMAPHNMAPQPNTSLLMSQPQHAALSTSELVQLLVDERQFKVELKSKIDTVSTKLEQLSDKIDAPQRGRDVGGFTPRNLLDLIQKMVLENERLTVDAEEKGRHVTLLRENINQLHERNQRVVDENSKFSQERVQLAQLDQVREERNRLTQELQLSVQEKNKLQREFLQLQSEKIKVEEDLASANETIEVAARKVQSLKRTQQGLEDQVRTLTDERERENIERESLKSTIETLSGEHKKYELKIREEQSRAKSLQQELETLRGELEEERDNHQRTVKLVEENKRKYITEIKKRESAFEEEKSSLEQQIEDLRATLKKERTASGTLSKEQLERVEQECEHKWQAVLTSREAESRQKLAHTVEEYESALQSLKEQREHDQHKIVQLQDTVRQLHEQRAAVSTATEVNVASTEQGTDQQWQARLTRAVKAERQRSAEDMTSAVKSIMNNVYLNLTQQFDEQAEYNTASVLTTIKRVVVQTTLEVLQRQKEQQEHDASESVEEVPHAVDTTHEEKSEHEEKSDEHHTSDEDAAQSANESAAVVHESPALEQSTLSSAPDHTNSNVEHTTLEHSTVEHEQESPRDESVAEVKENKDEEPAVQLSSSAVETSPSNEETAPSMDDQPAIEQFSTDDHAKTDSLEQSSLEHSGNEQSTLEHSTLEQSAVESSTLEQSAIEQSTLEPSTLESSVLEQPTAEPSTFEQSALEQSSLGESINEQSTLEQSAADQHSNEQSTTLDQSAVETKNEDNTNLDQSSIEPDTPLEQSALDEPKLESVASEARDDAPKHDVVEVDGDLKASLDQAMLSSQFGTSTLEHSTLPDERANPLEASMLPGAEDHAFAERDNDLLTSTLERANSLEQSAIDPSEEPKESEEEINMFETESKSEPAAETSPSENEPSNVNTENKETDENIQVPQGHSIEDYKEEDEPQAQEKQEEEGVEQVKTPAAQSPASRPSSAAKKSLFDDDDEDLFSKIPVKKATPKKEFVV
jgi:FK506-binding protein 15